MADERDHHALREHPNQGTLLDTTTREINPYWIDPAQALLVPVNPDHFEAHKLQLLLQRLDKQAEHKPAQFSSANYIAVLEKFTSICKQINKGDSAARGEDEDDDLDERDMVASRNQEAAATVGAGAALGVGAGISADNPLAR